jgi:hypothetical protein
MLDQYRLFFADDINDLADDDLNVATAVIGNVRLNRFAPAPVEQRGHGGHAGRRGMLFGIGDARQHPDAHLGVASGQTSQICWSFSHLGWVCPLLLAQASCAATITRIV